MKTIDGPSKIKIISLMLLSLLFFYCCFVYHNYFVYKSIKVVVKKNSAIEYGSGNYDIHEFIKNVEGKKTKLFPQKNQFRSKFVLLV